MDRFMGMMPTNEIEKSETWQLIDGSHVFIDAGPNGWTVRFPNHSSIWKDVHATTEENYKSAVAALVLKHPGAQKITKVDIEIEVGETIGDC